MWAELYLLEHNEVWGGIEVSPWLPCAQLLGGGMRPV